MSDSLQFIDFGAGHGQSFDFASACSPGRGLAVDKAESAIERCQEKGLETHHGDVLAFEQRNLAPATFAINLLQEMPGRIAFREALINIVRAATHYTVIQHPYFDKDPDLALNGMQVSENFTKGIVFKPTMADYLDFLTTHRESLSLAGMAVCVSGEATVVPMSLFEGSGDNDIRVPKTMRVVIGRKNVSRFRRAMFRAKSGKTAFIWEGE